MLTGLIVGMTRKGYEGEVEVHALQQLPNEAPETGVERGNQALVQLE